MLRIINRLDIGNTPVAVNAQVVVITCRPQDYLTGLEVSAETPVVDLAGGTLRAIDLGRVLQRHAAPPVQ